tara:strand:- start:164 stop:529 length:366 start_codon:yes stop_codon:yes gene_type:complete
MANDFQAWLNSPERQEQLARTKSINEATEELVNHLNKNNTNTDIVYTYDWGTKYHRIALYRNNYDNSYSKVVADDRVYCFIDQETGDVLAAKGWNRRAKGVRFNLLDEVSKAALFNAKEVA